MARLGGALTARGRDAQGAPAARQLLSTLEPIRAGDELQLGERHRGQRHVRRLHLAASGRRAAVNLRHEMIMWRCTGT